MDAVPFLCEECCYAIRDESAAVVHPVRLDDGELEFIWWHREHLPRSLRSVIVGRRKAA